LKECVDDKSLGSALILDVAYFVEISNSIYEECSFEGEKGDE
jgi:hypothetical protein